MGHIADAMADKDVDHSNRYNVIQKKITQQPDVNKSWYKTEIWVQTNTYFFLLLIQIEKNIIT